MEAREPIPVSSPMINGQIRRKPKKAFSPGVIQRLSLSKPLDAAIARTTVRELATDLGYSLVDQVRLSTAIFEIADKIVTHAGQGEIVIYWREEAHCKGLQFFCNDQGLHTPQLAALLQTGGDETESKLNFLRLKQLVDEFKFTEDPKYGNCVTMAVWLEQNYEQK
jgi:serine/threonine-protein kinase RsbT